MKAILFDLDETIFSSQQAYDLALKKVLSPWELKKYPKMRALVKAQLGLRNPSARNRLFYFKRLLEKENKFSPSMLLKIMDRYEAALTKEFTRQAKFLKRAQLFKALKRKYRLGIVTNENVRTQVIKLKCVDPRGIFFDFILCSEEWGVEKPDPEIFKEALWRLKLSPKDVAFVGDDIKADIVPALKLGMKAYLTNEFQGMLRQYPGAINISKLDELLM